MTVLNHLFQPDHKPSVIKGDDRDDQHRGMITDDPLWIAYFLLAEHNVFSHLSIEQGITLRDAIAQDVSLCQSKYNGRQGAHSGIRGNVTKQSVVRTQKCKFNWHYRPVAQKNGIVLISLYHSQYNQDKLVDGKVTYLAMLPDGSIKIMGGK